MSRRAERVIALRDGTVYDSVSDAAKAVGCSTGAIYKSIQKRVTIKGTQWAWVDEDTSIRRKKITLGDIPSEEEQRMLLYHFLRIRARARRCYRKHHGHLGKSTLSEACYNLSRQIHYISDGKLKRRHDVTWGGFVGSLALSREDMILTGGSESVEDAMHIFSYIKEHGDEWARRTAIEYMESFLYAEKQIQLIRGNCPNHKPDTRFVAELELVYGMQMVCAQQLHREI